MSKKDIIICRCEDVTMDDLQNAMEEGYTTFEDLKRILRVGMGVCQGNNCELLVQRELSKFLQKPIHEVHTHTKRPLTVGVLLQSIVDNEKNES